MFDIIDKESYDKILPRSTHASEMMKMADWKDWKCWSFSELHFWETDVIPSSLKRESNAI